METETTLATLPPNLISPAQRQRKPNIDGAEVILADGQTWMLAPTGVAPLLTELRDRLYDNSILGSRVRMVDVLQAAWVCLLANYDLTDAELSDLLTGLNDDQEQALATGTMNAVFGATQPLRTYTDWMLSSFHANGLDPAKIPAGMVPFVLDQLVRTGRAVPESEWVSSSVAAAYRRNLLDKFEQAGIKPKPSEPKP